MSKFKKGDRVRRRNPRTQSDATFTNGQLTVTVDRVDEDYSGEQRVWFQETMTYSHPGYIELDTPAAPQGMTALQVGGVEDFREYVYEDGFAYRIDNPKTVFIPASGPKQQSHRVTDVAGVTHYVPSGWRAIRWRGEVIA